ncbi:hypothetical protein OROHE_001278 [Orobanche hederae]
MESANSHHQLQDQVFGYSSSPSSATPSYHGIGTTTHAWSTTPTSFLNINNGFTSYPTEPVPNSRQPLHQETNLLSSSHYSSIDMSPADLGFHNWANNTTPNFTTNPSAQDEQFSSIKDELSDHYYRGYTELLSRNQRSNSSDDQLRYLQPRHDFGTKLFPKPSSSENLMNKNIDHDIDLFYAHNNGRGFGPIYPSVNVSNLNQMGLANAAALDMNLEALDLLTSSSFSGNMGTSPQNRIEILRDGFSDYRAIFDDHLQQSHQIPSYGSNNKISAPIRAVDATKRSSSKVEPELPLENATKKSRLEGRASCPPFKVRKEKLGDRISALQQLVAPFGKTDTASVLMEAIGYIKFLQDQVEVLTLGKTFFLTLSVPYMKASRNKSCRVIKAVPSNQSEKDEEKRRDLRSLGLCLVPLSCLSYITDGGGATVWPPSHFGGAPPSKFNIQK